MTNLVNQLLEFTIVIFLSLNTISATDSDVDPWFSQSNAKFASKLYSTVVQDSSPDENIVISPFSVQVAGAFLHSGATGPTAEEISKGFELSGKEKNSVEDAFKGAIEKHSHDYLSVANKLYLDKDIKVTPEFHTLAADKFLSTEENLDFAKSEETVGVINNWVSNVTHDKIKNFFGKDDFNEETKVALVNAIYFTGKWAIPFEQTKKDIFWINENSNKEVDMMFLSEFLSSGYITQLDSQVVKMDYNGTDLSMLIILPNKRQGLKELEQNLHTVDLIESQNKLSKNYLDVFLPKFKIEFTSQLKENLMKMGIEKMFTGHADFSNLVIGTPLKVDKAVHKAFIQVNEQGTEAGAASGFALKWYTIPETFKADHPFMFAIVSKTAVLFLGRFVG